MRGQISQGVGACWEEQSWMGMAAPGALTLPAPWSGRGCQKREVGLLGTPQGAGIRQSQDEGRLEGSAGVLDSELWGDKPWGMHSPREGLKAKAWSFPAGRLAIEGSWRSTGRVNATSPETMLKVTSSCWVGWGVCGGASGSICSGELSPGTCF